MGQKQLQPEAAVTQKPVSHVAMAQVSEDENSGDDAHQAGASASAEAEQA